MRRKHVLLGVLAVSCSSLVAVLLGIVTGSASGQTETKAAPKVTVITVTAGKPVELGFKLSKWSMLPAGTVTFKVTNKGYAMHDFKLCTTPATTSAKNACVGKVTKMLKRNQTVTLTVKLTKKGKYEFLCSVPGHAAAGMKGLLGIGVKVVSPTTGSTTSNTSGNDNTTTTTTPATTMPATTTTTPTTGGGGGGGGGADTNDGCPPGTTIQTANLGMDGDNDDGGLASDGDGCV
jgi:uncharacterized cupredoxin-like copper-binding protein